MGKLLDLLIKNNKEDINNFIMENGKDPKVICPIQIVEDRIKKEEDVNGKE